MIGPLSEINYRINNSYIVTLNIAIQSRDHGLLPDIFTTFLSAILVEIVIVLHNKIDSTNALSELCIIVPKYIYMASRAPNLAKVI